MRHSLKEWIVVTRPWSFPASAMPVLVTITWVWSQGLMRHWWLSLLSLINIILIHAAGNVWSDYFDYRRGVDRKDSTNVRTLVDGLFTEKEVLSLSLGLQISAIALGLFIVWLTDINLLWIGIAGICLSFMYPPLKYAAMGDLVIMACYALLPMLGMTLICGEKIVPEILWLAVPVGSITVAILHSNNTRDIETDKRANINTFAMLTGRRFASSMYIFELILPYLWLALMVSLGLADILPRVADNGMLAVSPWTLVAFITLPVAWKNISAMRSYSTQGIQSISTLDEATAKLQLMFSLTLIVGLVISGLCTA
ncbi:MAG: prenyltransferase [Bacteroidaceae bacterium]|nr:prenyltransferase [Bacteroidaceae bacterium]